MANVGRIGRGGLKALIYFEVASTLALIIGLIGGNIWTIGSGTHADQATLNSSAVARYVSGAPHLTVTDFLMNIIPNTFIDPFAKGDVLPVLLLAMLFGSPCATWMNALNRSSTCWTWCRTPYSAWCA